MIALAIAAQGNEMQMQEALKDWQQQMAEYQAALSLAETQEQKETLPPPAEDELVGKIWRSVSGSTGKRKIETTGKNGEKKTQEVRTYGYDEPWATPAVVWLVQRPEAFAKLFEGRQQELSRSAKGLLNSILTTHYSSPLIAEICHKLAESTSDLVYRILEKIYQHNPDATAKSSAALAMSIILSNPAYENAEGGPAQTRAKRIFYIKQALSTAPGDAMFGRMTLTQAAEEQIYQLRCLSPGAIPPRMWLTDTAGKRVAFPQEGKPNLLFFWSPDEEVGLSVMRKQSALLKQYPGLALCPVIPAAYREMLPQLMQEQGVDICYSDDDQGTAGRDYRVTQLPLAILVDSRARILYIGYPNMQLQTALSTCFSKMKQEAEAAPPHPKVQPVIENAQPPTLRQMPQL